MTHADIRRVLVERLFALQESCQKLPKPFRPYQVETIGYMRDWLEDFSGSRRGYVEHATGLGKTVLFSALAGFSTGLRTLIIVPTKILIEQTAKEVHKFTGGMLGHLSSLTGVHNDDGELIAIRSMEFSDVLVTTDESLVKYPRKIATQFDPQVVIFDECHWAFVGRVQSVLTTFFSNAAIIGFSATPDFLSTSARRGYTPVELDNGQVLYAAPERLATSTFNVCIDRRTVPWGVDEGWLAPLAWGKLEYDVSLTELPLQEGEGGLDYPVTALGRYMDWHWQKMSKTICDQYRNGPYGLADRQVFAVCPSVRSAELLAKAIKDLGVPSACITGGTSTNDRIAIMKAYRANRIRLLTSVMVLREGWDAPNAEVCLMLRPTRSRVLYVQTVGRVLRPDPDGKPKVALILDGHFNNTSYQPLTAPALYAPIGHELAMGDIFLQVGANARGLAPRVNVSPYLSADATAERYRVEQIVVEHIADKDGTIELEGEIYCSEHGLGKKLLYLALDYIHVWGAHGKIRWQMAQSFSGRRMKFYHLADVEAAQKELLVSGKT